MSSVKQIEVPLQNNIYMDRRNFQILVFINNALEQGWSIKKKDDSYIFSKKHETRREVFTDSFVDTFIESNIDITEFFRRKNIHNS